MSHIKTIILSLFAVIQISAEVAVAQDAPQEPDRVTVTGPRQREPMLSDNGREKYFENNPAGLEQGFDNPDASPEQDTQSCNGKQQSVPDEGNENGPTSVDVTLHTGDRVTLHREDGDGRILMPLEVHVYDPSGAEITSILAGVPGVLDLYVDAARSVARGCESK